MSREGFTVSEPQVAVPEAPSGAAARARDCGPIQRLSVLLLRAVGSSGLWLYRLSRHNSTS